MTDREPLRVGPLVLKWDDDNTGRTQCACFVTTLAGGGRLRVFWSEQYDWGWSIDWEVHGQRYASPRTVATRLEEHLTETGYLAQYRSRRRLLARECERRAEYWRSVALDCADRDANYTKAVLAHAGARAAKYARWAEALRNA